MRATHTWMTAVAALALAEAAGCGSSSSTCQRSPCPLPLAAVLHVTGASGSAIVPGIQVKVSGARSGEGAGCLVTGVTTDCAVGGPAGSYHFEISAPGYVTAEADATVEGTNPACGCGTATTAQVPVALAPVGARLFVTGPGNGTQAATVAVGQQLAIELRSLADGGYSEWALSSAPDQAVLKSTGGGNYPLAAAPGVYDLPSAATVLLFEGVAPGQTSVVATAARSSDASVQTFTADVTVQ